MKRLDKIITAIEKLAGAMCGIHAEFLRLNNRLDGLNAAELDVVPRQRTGEASDAYLARINQWRSYQEAKKDE